MTRITSTSLAFVLALFGCGHTAGPGDDTSDDSSDDSAGNPDAHTTTGSGVPVSGLWHYDQVTPVTNTCNPNINHGESGNFVIDTVTSTSFRVVPADGTDPFTCTLDTGVFGCPNRAAHVEDYRPSVDAVLTVHAEAHGTFHNDTHATGTQNATIDCVGTQCNALGGLPCTFSQDFAISKD